MVRYISFVGILVIIALLSGATIAPCDVEILLEAELANKVQGPMTIAVPEDVNKYGDPQPDEPSNGKFVWSPGVPATSGGDSGFMEFIIDIPEDGTYAIWARVVAWDGSSDSFWVTWEPADLKENPQQTQNMDFRWPVGNGNTWHWDRVEAWKADDTRIDREWELDKGETKLTIFTREDATMLDCLYITDDIASGGVNARVPTDGDREAQLAGHGRPVESAGKLSTTWGSIRSQYR